MVAASRLRKGCSEHLRALLVCGGAARWRWPGQLFCCERVSRRARHMAASVCASGDKRAVGCMVGGGHGSTRWCAAAHGGVGGGLWLWSHWSCTGPRRTASGGATTGTFASWCSACAVGAHARWYACACLLIEHGVPRSRRVHACSDSRAKRGSCGLSGRHPRHGAANCRRHCRCGYATDGCGRRLARRGGAAQPAAARRRRLCRAADYADV